MNHTMNIYEICEIWGVPVNFAGIDATHMMTIGRIIGFVWMSPLHMISLVVSTPLRNMKVNLEDYSQLNGK